MGRDCGPYVLRDRSEGLKKQMSRRHKADKRVVNPDPKFGEVVITKFMNAVMKEGKKSAAESIVYGAFERMEAEGKSEPGAALPSGARQRHARSRGALAARRRRHLPGAGRGAQRAAPGARHPLDDHGRPRPQREHDGRSACRASFWMRPTTGAPRSRSGKTHTRWQRRTAPSPITAGDRIFWSADAMAREYDIKDYRNFGIMAHIDAGQDDDD